MVQHDGLADRGLVVHARAAVAVAARAARVFAGRAGGGDSGRGAGEPSGSREGGDRGRAPGGRRTGTTASIASSPPLHEMARRRSERERGRARVNPRCGALSPDFEVERAVDAVLLRAEAAGEVLSHLGGPLLLGSRCGPRCCRETSRPDRFALLRCVCCAAGARFYKQEGSRNGELGATFMKGSMGSAQASSGERAWKPRPPIGAAAPPAHTAASGAPLDFAPCVPAAPRPSDTPSTLQKLAVRSQSPCNRDR